MSRSNRLVLVDADGLLYIAGAIGETRFYNCVFEKDDGSLYELDLQYVDDINQHIQATHHALVDREQYTVPGPLSFSLQVAKQKMKEMQDRYGRHMEVYIKGDGTNWRDDVATLQGYKANRTAVKPYHLDSIREYLMDNWNAIPVSGKEADDMIATRAYEASKPVVICSPDKDLDQIPGLHWNYKKSVEYTIDNYEARWFFWQQVLSGDSADNIPGVWRIGEAKANTICAEMSEHIENDEVMWLRVVEEYDNSMGIDGCPYAGMPAELVALENARLVWMQTEHGVLWTPPGQPKEYIEGGWDD